jgi:hypothetical protein
MLRPEEGIQQMAESKTAELLMASGLAKEARDAAASRMLQIERTIEGVRNTINEHGATLAEIKANTSPLPELHRRLRENETSTNSLWTVLKVTWAVIVAIIGATWIWVKH